MFTGIVRLTGRVAAISTPSPSSPNVRLTIEHGPAGDAWVKSPGLGDSIAVDGCCLTVATPPPPPPPSATPQTGGVLNFDVIPESLAKTALGGLRVGSPVHLEQAASATTLLDGHVVQGHVDGVADVLSVVSDGEWRIRLRPPAPLMEFIVPKGSVTLAGVSLTVAALDPAAGWFEVALIPTTLAKTNLGTLRPGSHVNLECDSMAKTVVHWLKHYSANLPKPSDR